jgi:hypothetical protein
MKWTPFLVAIIGSLGMSPAAIPQFRAETIDPDIKIGYGLTIGDVDGDGRVDILMADQFDIVWYENPTWAKHVIASKLTLKDNVCIAAHDLDGDGKVEIAVGANWNPGNTISRRESGSVHYLIAPEDRTQRWEVVKLPNEPTVHRMHWILPKTGQPELVVLPLHGSGNKGGEGDNGVRIFSYRMPQSEIENATNWNLTLLDESLHKTHNFDPFGPELAVGGTEGLKILHTTNSTKTEHWIGEPGKALPSGGIGEIRWGPYPNHHGSEDHRTFAAIEPLHGNEVVIYEPNKTRVVLDTTLKQGHGLVCGQFLPGSRQQIVAGWRDKNAQDKVGIRMYHWENDGWTTHTIDDNTMACEDIKASDLNGDGKLDLIASGRATKNVIIYWNEG